MTERPGISEFAAFQGRGWRFGRGDTRRGITFDPRWGRVEMSEGEIDVQEAIFIILSTRRGSRAMRPEFGCSINELPFQAISSQLTAEIQRGVTEALRRFEARIDVEAVRVGTEASLNGQLEVDVVYRVRTTNQRGNLVYPFYFREGA